MLPGQGAPRGTHYHFPLWTAVARALAGRAIATLRIDFLSVGDSTGRRPALEGSDEGTRQALAAAEFAMAMTNADRVGFAGNCYGGRSALLAAASLPSATGAISAFTAPRPDAVDVSGARRARHLIRSQPLIRSFVESPAGRRVLEPTGRLLLGRSRGLRGSGRDIQGTLNGLLPRARVLFVNGDDERKYHERLRPFLDRYVPTLPEEHRQRLRSEVIGTGIPGGYTSFAAQEEATAVVVEHATAFSVADGTDRAKPSTPHST